MELKNIIENIVFRHQKQVTCIGIFLVSRNEWKISVIRARINKKEIHIVDSAEDINDLSEVANRVSHNVPVILHVDGWGVLVKNNKTGNGSIPVDDKEFFIKQYIAQDDNTSYFSIIRVDLLKSIIDACFCASLNIIGIAAGPFHVALLSPYFEEGLELKAGKWNIILRNSFIQSCEAAGNEIKVNHHLGGETITSGLLPLFADIVAFFSGVRERHPAIDKHREEFVYGRFVKYTIVFSLSALLFLLLLNFLTWDNLRKRNNELTSEATYNEQLLAELEEKGKELKEKRMLVAQYIGSNESTGYAWYADKLCSTLPIGLRLTLMDVQPLNKKQKPGIPIEYRNRLIVIEGDADHMSEISDWMDEIKKEEWVKKVELISFYSDEEQLTGHFKLQINY